MSDKKNGITAAIICKNAEKTIKQTLAPLSFVEEIIILDDNSSDHTLRIAQEFNVKIITGAHTTFADKRNTLLKALQTDWIFYIDTDEVVSDQLATAIQEIADQNIPGVYKVTRENYFLNTKMYPDFVERLFHKSLINGWKGAVHESPIITTKSKLLTAPLLHFTHTDITSMLEKTNHWSDIEADLRIQAHHPPIAWWRLIRIALTESWHQWGKLRVNRFGRNGMFEGYFQVIDKLIVYTKLWEKQQN